VIRRATALDAAAVGALSVRARDLMGYLPRIADADRPRLGTWIVERHEVWVAERAGRVVGFIGVSPRHGFDVAERTDGAGNMEKEPDVRYEWVGVGSSRS
jgi:hypothetical protein